MDVPTFKKGDPVSAGKLQSLADCVKILNNGASGSGEGSLGNTPGYDNPVFKRPRPWVGLDFDVEFRIDSEGVEGWCYHQGRVIFDGKENLFGEKEWNLFEGKTWEGSIYLAVSISDSGDYLSSAIVFEEDNAKLCFLLAKWEANRLTKVYAGQPIVVSYQVVLEDVSGKKIDRKWDIATKEMTYVVAGGGNNLPWQVTSSSETNEQGLVNNCLHFNPNGGVFRSTNGILFGEFSAMTFPCSHAQWVIGIKWCYDIQGEVTESEIFYEALDGYCNKEVITPIVAKDGIGQSRINLAWGTYKAAQGEVAAQVTVNQLAHTHLRAYWLPGYVDSVPGSIGQYADAAVGLVNYTP